MWCCMMVLRAISASTPSAICARSDWTHTMMKWTKTGTSSTPNKSASNNPAKTPTQATKPKQASSTCTRAASRRSKRSTTSNMISRISKIRQRPCSSKNAPTSTPQITNKMLLRRDSRRHISGGCRTLFRALSPRRGEKWQKNE